MMQLIGIEGYLISTDVPNQFYREFDKILLDKSIGLILLDEKYLLRYKEYFKHLKLQNIPIIVEIPDLKAPLDKEYFRHLLEQYLNLTLKE